MAMDPARGPGGVADIDVDMVGYSSPADGESQSSGESYRDSSSSSSASDEPAVTDASIRNFCREVVELVAQGDVSAAALQKYLTSMHALLQAPGGRGVLESSSGLHGCAASQQEVL